MHKIWEQSVNQRQKRSKAIEEENQKLLNKLLEISTRTINNDEKIGKNKRDNPFRKNCLKAIKKENEELGERLLHLRSDLECRKIIKSMQKYEKAKRSMKINRRPKLPHL